MTMANANSRICNRSTPRARQARCSDEKIESSMKVSSSPPHQRNEESRRDGRLCITPSGFRTSNAAGSPGSPMFKNVDSVENRGLKTISANPRNSTGRQRREANPEG